MVVAEVGGEVEGSGGGGDGGVDVARCELIGGDVVEDPPQVGGSVGLGQIGVVTESLGVGGKAGEDRPIDVVARVAG